VAQAIRAKGDVAILLGVRGERPQLICTRSEGVSVDAGAVLRAAVAVAGGRGGGRPDWAQGGVPADADLQSALDAGMSALLS
jgi:alanyl-tRNA synthetase